MKELLIGLGLLSFPAAVFVFFGNSGPGSFGTGADAMVDAVARGGEMAALAPVCAACHGRQAQGTARAPNLIQPDYRPARRSDAQFRRAVRQGMPARQGFGAMPATPGVSELSLNRTIALVRELQRANGIR